MGQGCKSRNPNIDTPVRQERATIRTVAAHAGVSTATVSRALSGSGYVSPELQSAVTRAADELGYSGNAVAAALRSSQSNTVGMIVPEIASPLMGRVIEEVEGVLQGMGIQLLLSSSQRDLLKEEMAVKSLIARRVDGLIISPVSGSARFPVPGSAVQALPCIQIAAEARGLVVDGSGAARNQVLLLVIERLKSLPGFHLLRGKGNVFTNHGDRRAASISRNTSIPQGRTVRQLAES